MIGFNTLLRKELLRFSKILFQTVAAPILTALLYLLIFAHVLKERIDKVKMVDTEIKKIKKLEKQKAKKIKTVDSDLSEFL